MVEPDADLLSRVRSGDTVALANLFDAKRSQLLSFISQHLGRNLQGRIEPEDVLQDTAIAALRALTLTDLTDRDPFNWLCQLAEQRIIDRVRELEAAKRDVHREISGHNQVLGQQGSSGELLEMLVASLTSVTKAVVRNEHYARLHECLIVLPEQTQEVLRLRFVEGQTTRAIGERIGKSDGAVRVLISRILKELQTAMGLDARP
jgi:RNA polymerase sigma-70 factor (subfamily 1)